MSTIEPAPGVTFQAPAPPIRSRTDRLVAYEIFKLDQAAVPIVLAKPEPVDGAS